MDKPEALRLADELDGMPVNEFYEALGDEAADELRRLHAENEGLKRRVEASAQALRQWLDKTEWIQETGHGSELGLHRADAVRQRLEKTEAQRDALLEACRAMFTFIERHAPPRGQQPEAIHVVPLNDLREHVASKDCWCEPTEDDVDDVWIHHSMDKREEYEEGRKPT